jgi:spore germination protein GerM
VAEDRTVPFSLLDPHAPALFSPATGTGSQQVDVCFVSDGKVIPVPVALDAPVELDDVVAALDRVPAGSATELRTAVGDPPIVDGVALEAGTARVDLASTVTELGGQEQLLAVAQLVCTLTSRPGVGRVSFSLAGTPVEVPRGDGSLTDEPVSRDDYTPLLG